MKIYYIVKRIDKVPSCQYNILMLHDLGYEVIALFGQSTQEINALMENRNISYKVMQVKAQKAIGVIAEFRSFVKRNVETEDNSILFLGTADTAIALIGMFKKNKTVTCIKELYDHDKKYYQYLLHKVCRASTAVVACEKNRARYMKTEWGLDKMPYVISNRPYTDNCPKGFEGSTEQNKRIISQIRDRKAVIYQANHIHYAKELVALAEAMRQVSEDYILLLVGNVDNEDDIVKIKKIFPNVICTGYIKSPSHLEITSNAHIGISVYQDNSLNNLFCAPNKIYEYACYGVPTLANDVPGLIETVGLNQTGVCVDWTSSDKIRDAILLIESAYDFYSKNALEFYRKSDTKNILASIVSAITEK